jgi:hypothetical protein
MMLQRPIAAKTIKIKTSRYEPNQPYATSVDNHSVALIIFNNDV